MEKPDLAAIRTEIDKLDAELAALLEQRMVLVSQIADYKRHAQIQITDRSREQKVIENVLSHVQNKAFASCIQHQFEAIMAESRKFQNQVIDVKPAPKPALKFGLLGETLKHSLSPVIHTIIFEMLDLQAEYNLVEVSKNDLPGFWSQLRDQNYSGINVTIPYKTDAMRQVDSLSQEALRVGAVNTILTGIEMKGHNTDYKGFGMALDYYGASPSGKRCACLGTGGSARAVVSWLEDAGASQIVLVSRDPESATLKFPELMTVSLDQFMAEGYDLIVNTTPVGMYPNTGGSPLSREQLQGCGFVFDLIYNPAETVLLSYARDLSIGHANGLYMLVAQAVLAEEIWLNTKLSSDFTTAVFKELIKRI